VRRPTNLKHSSAARFFTNLEADVMSNSVPLTLLAAGLGWLIFRPGPRNLSAGDSAYALAFRRLAQMSKVAGQNASRAGSTVHSRATDAQEAMASLARRTTETAGAVSQAAQNTAGATKDALTSTVQTVRSTAETVRSSASAVEAAFPMARVAARARWRSTPRFF
jgi:methyl-accepting chemotaxis protein